MRAERRVIAADSARAGDDGKTTATSTGEGSEIFASLTAGDDAGAMAQQQSGLGATARSESPTEATFAPPAQHE